MSKGTLLVIGSNATRIEIQGGGWGPTGQYLNETTVPVMAAIAAGYDIVLATPNGRPPVIDPVSDTPSHFNDDAQAHQAARAFFATDPAMTNVRTLRDVIAGGLDRFAGVFVPGGQAPGVDLMQDADLRTILTHFHAHAKPTALLCHGPIATAAALPHAREFRAALIAGSTELAAKWTAGWPYAGYRMTIFSNTEEKIVEDHILKAKLHFNVADALTLAGATITTTPTDFAPHVVIDRELITGQNPASDQPIAKALVEALDRATA